MADAEEYVVVVGGQQKRAAEEKKEVYSIDHSTSVISSSTHTDDARYRNKFPIRAPMLPKIQMLARSFIRLKTLTKIILNPKKRITLPYWSIPSSQQEAALLEQGRIAAERMLNDRSILNATAKDRKEIFDRVMQKLQDEGLEAIMEKAEMLDTELGLQGDKNHADIKISDGPTA
jgi:hypothetical protein